MNKFGFLLLAAFASTNALASEVGAPFPQLANSTALVAVAIAETGASASLVRQPDIDVVQSTTQHSPLDTYIAEAYEQLATDIEERVLLELRQFDRALAQR